ncbi:hypothetical protein AJ79_08883 [Helicocarpus griseus UAMH5409]|uniref:Uncharacterized protein n=1 Tax=Helicocarpus griseus UAMH5409 TaxID=1447875 RepID=A0A2B7WNP9_9EURO|nr:hypothetical protein AJ79_08883 [Helicocarpus griseus UAMH5409]
MPSPSSSTDMTQTHLPSSSRNPDHILHHYHYQSPASSLSNNPRRYSPNLYPPPQSRHDRNDAYEPRPRPHTSNHHVVHLPQVYAASDPNAASHMVPYLAPQSIKDQRSSQSSPIQEITVPTPVASVSDHHSSHRQSKSEMGYGYGHSHGRGHRHGHSVLSSERSSPHRQRNSRVSGYADDDEDDEDMDEDDDEVVASKESENAFFILLRLSFLVPPFSLVATLYALAVLVFLLLSSPLRLCKPTPFFQSPLSAQLCTLLLPLLHTHQRLITPHHHHHYHTSTHPYDTAAATTTSQHQKITTIDTQHSTTTSPSSQPSSTSTTATTPTPTTPTFSPLYSSPMLLLVHLLSPLFITPILFAAWIAAFFWVFAMILGNPDGTERRDDGRVAVLGVRNWWWIWLCRARRRGVRRGRRRKGRGRGSDREKTGRMV